MTKTKNGRLLFGIEGIFSCLPLSVFQPRLSSIILKISLASDRRAGECSGQAILRLPIHSQCPLFHFHSFLAPAQSWCHFQRSICATLGTLLYVCITI